MSDTRRIFDVDKSIKAQSEYCHKKGCPYFAPDNGVCWKCNQNIYKPVVHDRTNLKGEIVGNTYTTGISVEEAGSGLITGCPHCHWSYCD
jgi:hypothetical protein